MKRSIAATSFSLSVGLLIFSFQNCSGGGFLGRIATISASTSIRNAAFTMQSSVNSKAVCDGVNDSTAVLQQEIDSNAGMNNVIIPAGATCLTTGLKLPSRTHLTVNGTLFLSANSRRPVINAYAADNVTVDGAGVIDGNRLQQHCISSDQCAGVQAFIGSNFTVSGLTVQNVFFWPVNIVTINGAQILNMVLKDSGSSVQFAAATTNGYASGLKISNINDEGFAFYGGVSNSRIENSEISFADAGGISVLDDSAQSAPCHDLVITNVLIHHNKMGGIELDTGVGANANHTNIQILNSELHHNNQGNYGGRGGIYNRTANNVIVSNVQIHDDGNGAGPVYGIFINSGVQTMSVDHVTVLDEGNVANSAVGLQIGSATNVTVTNSSFVNSTALPLIFGFNGDPGAGFSQSGNTVGPSIGPAINIPGAGSVASTAGNVAPAPAPSSVTTPMDQSSIVVKGSALCIDVPGASLQNGVGLDQYSCNGTNAQKFRLMANADGTYSIVNVNSNLCLDIPGASTALGAKVQQYTCNSSMAQHFWLNGDLKGSFTLANLNSGLCIDVQGNSGSSGTALQQFTCNNTGAQTFSLAN